VTFPFIFAFRADLEAKAGGNPSWNTGVNYARDLAKSADAREVRALYRSAGLSLGQDVRRLNDSQRISADPNAVAWLTRNIVFNGDISVPVLTMHTTGDGLVVPENEQALGASYNIFSAGLHQLYPGALAAAIRGVPAPLVRVKRSIGPNGPPARPGPARPPRSLGRPHWRARRPLHERPDLLGDAAPVRGRGQLTEEREQA